VGQGAKGDTAHVKSLPGLVILWDIATFLMEEVEGDENLPGEQEQNVGTLRFRSKCVVEIHQLIFGMC
jgi:hypothetical protein